MTDKQFRLLYWVGIISILLISGGISVKSGKEAGFDLLLYHYYNAFAFLNNREGFDILPAGFRTFWNPVGDLAFYACTSGLTARTCGFAAGIVHGLNYVMVVPIAALVLARPGENKSLTGPLPWLLAAAGALGAGSLGMLGGPSNDNLVSVFFLISLLLVCREAPLVGSRFSRSVAWVGAAGIVVGLGTGLKLTLAPFGLALVLAPMFYPIGWPYRLLLAGFCGLGAIIGALVTSGYSMLQMYQAFGNPLFPYFVAYFNSPYRDFMDVRDLRYVPKDLIQAFFYPLIFAFDPMRVSEFSYRDFRLPAMFVLALAGVVAFALRRSGIRVLGLAADRPIVTSPPARVFLGVLLIAYVGWMAQASVYRYAFPLEVLSFVVLALLLRYLVDRRAQMVVLAVLAAGIIPTTSRVALRRLPWDGTHFIAVALPALPKAQSGAIVLMSGTAALSFVIPAFPPDVRFLGVDVMDRTGFATGENGGRKTPAQEKDMGPFAPLLRGVITAHRGPALGMFQFNDSTRAISAFARYGFGYDPAACGLITSNVSVGNPIQLCELAPM